MSDAPRGADQGPSPSLAALFDHAREGAGRRPPEETRRRWALLRTFFPQHVHGYLGEGRLALQAGEIDHAERILEDGIAATGGDRRLDVARAACAEARSDWAEAARRWTAIEDLPGWEADDAARLVKALVMAGRGPAADAALTRSLCRFPDARALAMHAADRCAARGDHEQAVARWRALRDDHPRDRAAIDGLGQAVWRLGLQAEAAGGADRLRPVDVGRTEDATLRRLVLRFESLGQNCEFGLVQRHFGAEPLNLLRWTTTPPGILVAALRKGLADFGRDEHVQLDLAKSEVMVNETAYGMRFHSFVQKADAPDLAALRSRQARHLRHLARLFVERLAEADKIYVYKADQDGPTEAYAAIYAALRAHGDAALLLARRADADNPAGSVRHLRDRFYAGYVGRFGHDRGPVWDIDFEGWTTMLDFAWSVIG